MINDIITFMIVAFAVFVLVKQANRIKDAFEHPVPPTTKDLGIVRLKADATD